MESVFKPPPPLNLNGNLQENWRRFRQLYNIYMKATKKDKEAKDVQVAILLNLLGEEAIEVYNTLKLSEAEQKDIDTVISKFEEYCNPRKNIVYQRYLFYKRGQGENEPFDHFLTEITTLMKNCEFGDQADSMLRDRIVLGINDVDVQKTLLKIDDLDLKKAIEHCRVAELTSTQTKTVQERSTILQINKKKYCKPSGTGNDKNGNEVCRTGKQKYGNRTNFNNSNSNKTRKYKLCNKCNLSHPFRKCPAYGKTCLRCGYKNHFAGVCANKRKRIQCIEKADINKTGDDDEFEEDAENLYIDSLCMTVSASKKGNFYWSKDLLIENFKINFKIDTGSEVNILPSKILKELRQNYKIKQIAHKLEAFGGFVVDPIGSVEINAKVNNDFHKVKFLVVDTNCKPILGLQTCISMGLIKKIDQIAIENDKNSFIQPYKDNFKGIGRFPTEAHIYYDKTIQPVIKSPRRIPYSIQEKVKIKLKEMVSAGIIKEIEDPKSWVSNLVIVEKADKSLRLCLDPRELNTCIQKHSSYIPTIEDLRIALKDMKIFSVLDLKDSFWQVVLDEESSSICAFATMFGCYQFLRLPFGIKPAAGLLQNFIRKYFGNLNGVVIYIDDILVGGRTVEEHDANLKAVMEKARSINVKFNESKFQYKVKEVKYMGHIFSSDGMRIDPERIATIQLLKIPENKKELQRILGMVNYLHCFIPSMSELTADLRELLKNKSVFAWLPVHTRALNKIKDVLTNAPVLRQFDPSKDIIIQCDASKNAIGCCLLQEGRPVGYASKSFTSSEENYAQVEKEFLAILFACIKFHNYIYGRKVEIHTDHKPLVSLYSKGLVDIVSPRLQRIKLRLLKYDIHLRFVPGRLLHIADTLSRNVRNEKSEENVDDSLTTVVHSISMSEGKCEKFRAATTQDKTLQLLKKFVMLGWPNDSSKIPTQLKVFWNIRHDIHFINEIAFYKDRIIVPTELRYDMLQFLHEPHFGINKTLARASKLLYWPQMNKDIYNVISSCKICEKYRASNPKEKLKCREIPYLPFHIVGCDILYYEGRNYLVLMDYLSKWLEIVCIKSTSSSEVISALKQIFAQHGIPKSVVADNMPFSSYECKKFGHEWGFSFETSSPHYPRSNGLAEKAVHISKNILRKCKEEGNEIFLSLLEYRCSPVAGTCYTPSQILMGRQLRTKLPCKSSLLLPKIVLSEAREALTEKQGMTKSLYDRTARARDVQFNDNDNIVYQNFSKDQWHPGQIIRAHKSPRSYVIRNEGNRELRRNQIHLRKSLNAPRFGTTEQEQVLTSATECENNNNNNNNTSDRENNFNNNNDTSVNKNTNRNNYITRYGRTIKKPVRYSPE